jgi:hypothetical protein
MLIGFGNMKIRELSVIFIISFVVFQKNTLESRARVSDRIYFLNNQDGEADR